MKHVYYWVFPLSFMAMVIVGYFFGFPGSDLVFPEVNREFGIVENLQLLVILAIIIVSLIHFKVNLFYKLVLFFSIFIFLEEIDYGSHIMWLITGSGETFLREIVGENSLHNANNSFLGILLKNFSKFLLILCFIAPFFNNIIKSDAIRFFIPDRFLAATAFVAIMVYGSTKLLPWDRLGDYVEYRSNLGELVELMIYYLCLLYLVELVKKSTRKRKSLGL